MRKTLGIGIIGTGQIAREHAHAIAAVFPAARLVAVADVASERAREFCETFDVRRGYRDGADLIADPDVDLVTVATPPSAHEHLAVHALEGGKRVLCEKPLASSLAGAVRVAEADARYPGRLSVSYQMRYDPSHQRLVWVCQHGAIGEIRSAVVERHSYIPGSSEANGWWGSWSTAGGGVLITQLIHELDLLIRTMGQPLAVGAVMDTRHTTIESEDYAEVTIQFANQRTARCVASVNSGRVGGGLTVRGSHGSVALPWRLDLDDAAAVGRVTEALDSALPDTRSKRRSIVRRGARFAARCLGFKTRPDLTPHARLYVDIARCIEGGAPMPISSGEALSSLELCMAAYESALSGKEVGLPLDRSSIVYGGVTRDAYAARGCVPQTTAASL